MFTMKHVCSCIAYKRENVVLFAHNVYTTKVYYLCYNEIIHFMPELDIKDRDGYEIFEFIILYKLTLIHLF